jgi:hypothetical protein
MTTPTVLDAALLGPVCSSQFRDDLLKDFVDDRTPFGELASDHALFARGHVAENDPKRSSAKPKKPLKRSFERSDISVLSSQVSQCPSKKLARIGRLACHEMQYLV